MKVSIRTQIDSVALALANKRGYIENLRRLIKKKQRPEIELTMAESSIPGLEAAVKTLEWLEKNETRIKEALSNKGVA